MNKNNIDFNKEFYDRLKSIINKKNTINKKTYNIIVQKNLKKSKKIIKLTEKHKTPFYLVDLKQLDSDLNCFMTGFSRYFKNFTPYYAVKSNDHPFVVKRAVEKGFGIDISSIRELEIAVNAKADKILFNGPGKTNEELEKACKYNKNIIINLDSFTELSRLNKIAQKLNKHINAGIRVYTSYHDSWTKFGISLKDLSKFWVEKERYKNVNVIGIHFHMSWNGDATKYQLMIKEIGHYLKNNFTKEQLEEIKFIDFGGGFLPEINFGEYYFKQEKYKILKIVNDYFGEKSSIPSGYEIFGGISVDDYAKNIKLSFDKHMDFLPDVSFFTEPGRIISHSSMLLVVKVIDIKPNNSAIVDGGINMVGWERFEDRYYPIINMTRPSNKEKSYNIYGPLCTPQDFFGHSYFGESIHEGDILTIIEQGDYTYSLAQNFIKKIPEVYVME